MANGLNAQGLNSHEWLAPNRISPIIFNPNPNTKFNVLRQLGFREKGKNSTTAVVGSRSKKDQRKKEWIRKNLTLEYDLSAAASEVFFGQLAAKIHGKNKSPKTKFNPDKKGIVSRIIGDDNHRTQSMANFIVRPGINLNSNAQQSLMQALVFGVIIGDRDIAARNLIVKNEAPKPKLATQVYGVDHEFGGFNQHPHFAKLKDFLPKVFADHHVLTDIILYNKDRWSAGSGVASAMHMLDRDLPSKLDDQITNQDVQNEFSKMANKIAAHNFEICREIREEIYAQVTEADSVYSKDEIDYVIMPTVDTAIKTLKENVKVVQDIYEEHNPGLIKGMMNRMGM